MSEWPVKYVPKNDVVEYVRDRGEVVLADRVREELDTAPRSMFDANGDVNAEQAINVVLEVASGLASDGVLTEDQVVDVLLEMPAAFGVRVRDPQDDDIF